MSSLQIIQDHDKWRKGIGGAPAGLAGESDGDTYAGLDLNLITFASTSFSGSSFSATSFQDAAWTTCRFSACTFSLCQMQRIRISECTFVGCTFSRSQFQGSNFSACVFTDCTWSDLNFDGSQWVGVSLPGCKGQKITGRDLVGERVDFTGSQFEDMQLTNARIN